MRIATVLGSVVLSQSHPSLRGGRLRLVAPATLAELQSDQPPVADAVVAWDDLGAGVGGWVALADGAEAAQPFRPELKPIDAYCAALLDRVEV